MKGHNKTVCTGVITNSLATDSIKSLWVLDKVFQLVQEGHGLELRLVQRHLLCVFFLGGVAVEVVVIQEVG